MSGPLLPDVSARNLQPEVMDQPGLADAEHHAALSALRRINILSGIASSFWRPIHALAKRSPHQTLRVLDVASGGGDITIELAQRAEQAGVPMVIEGCDVSPVALEFATRQAERRGANVRFFAFDVLNDSFAEPYDVIYSSLFLHHLTAPDAERLLAQMAQNARQAVFINDLRRNRWGLFLAHLASRVLTRSPVVRVDAPRSVEGAFTMEEVARLAHEAGMPEAHIRRTWPSRFFLSWYRPV